MIVFQTIHHIHHPSKEATMTPQLAGSVDSEGRAGGRLLLGIIKKTYHFAVSV
jgi:hypothetical protein